MYAVSGINNVTLYQNNERFNDDLNYWLSRSNITTAVNASAGYSDNSFGYVVGGSTSGLTAPVSTNYQYSDTLDSWSTKNSLSSFRLFPF
jgi:hypothetical protein